MPVSSSSTFQQPIKPCVIPSCRFLTPGSKFQGHQKSGHNTYHVNIEVLQVDLPNSFLCGYLMIKGLADDWPNLSTFFEGEIITNCHGFVTSKWNADKKIDQLHWQKFSSFNPVYFDSYNPTIHDSSHIYFRIKELFLVPDHRIKSISGASYSGFYYMCLCRTTGVLEGVYYHCNSEMYQMVKVVCDETRRGGFDSFEFR